MKDHKEKFLKEGIRQLPVYTPPTTVWEDISDQLDQITDNPYQSLPQYEAPDWIWENIQANIDQPKPSRPVIIQAFRYAAILSGVILTAVIGYYQFGVNSGEKIVVELGQEEINHQLPTLDWEEDQEAFAIIEQFCENDPICKQPEFKELKAELDELNAAREELKSVLTNFNEDPDLLAQLTRIELERTDILKAIIAKI